MSKREELARALFERHVPMNLNEEGRRSWWIRNKDSHLRDVDAILDCLMEPSEEMLAAAMGGDAGRVSESPVTALARKAIWQAMLRAAKES